MNKPQLSLPLLRFKGFEGEWKKYSFENNIKIFDGPHQTPNYCENGYPFYSVETITNNKYKYIDIDQYEKFRKIYDPKIGDILFSRIGIIGETKIVNKLGFSIYVSICAIRTLNNSLNNEYINFYFQTIKFKDECRKKSLLTAIPIKINIIDMYKLWIIAPSLPEQQKIAKFFFLLDKQISLWKRKLELYELFYKHIKQLSLKNIEKFNDKKSFNEVFLETREINKNNFSQYTVGKHSILKIEKTNYDLSNHKIFTINNLLLGIGIEEVQFNLHINNGCCSPIYKVYNLINKELNQYFYLFLKDILIKNKAFISRKSTRRNYEFLYKDLLYFDLPIPDFNFKNNITTLMKIENILELVTHSLNIYKNKKCFFLGKLFI